MALDYDGWLGEKERALFAAVALLETSEEAQDFLLDLITPKEMQKIAKRWCLIMELLEGLNQTDAKSECAANKTTAGRAQQALVSSSGASRVIWQRLKG